MTSVTKLSQNLFAVLNEESDILKKKEKRDRAERRRLLKQEAIEKQRQERLERELLVQSNQRWADMKDDDDDDETDNVLELYNKDSQIQEAEESVSDESEEDDEKEVGHPIILSDTPKLDHPTHIPPEVIHPPQPILNKSFGQKPLSKKERQQQEAQELQYLDDLLNHFGLNPINVEESTEEKKDNQELQSLTEDNTCIEGRKTKKKKKKSKNEMNPVHIEENTEKEISVENNKSNICKAEAIAAAKLKSIKKKPKQTGISESALAEAKKKTELQKSKQKKDKFKFER